MFCLKQKSRSNMNGFLLFNFEFTLATHAL